MCSTMPLMCSKSQNTPTTWSASFANDKQFTKRFKGSLVNLCRLQDKKYEDEDEDDEAWLSGVEQNQHSYPTTANERPYSICSTLHGFEYDEDDQFSPPSDATVFSPLAKCDEYNKSSYTFEVIKNTPKKVSEASLGELDLNYKFPKQQNTSEPPLKVRFLKYNMKTNVSNTSELVKSSGNDKRKLSKVYDVTEPMTPGTFREALQDDSLSVQRNILSQSRASLILDKREAFSNGGTTPVVTENKTSPLSPFVRTWIYKSRSYKVTLDKDHPPLYMKSPLYVIKELQQLGLRPSSN